MITKLKPYMVYNRKIGSSEGASLAFHFTARKARNMVWKSGETWFYEPDQFTDLASVLIKPFVDVFPLGDMDKLLNNEPHIVYDPEVCESCGYWGCGVDYDESGLAFCESCGESVGSDLLVKFERWLEVMEIAQ
jgi:hypothetical protein